MTKKYTPIFAALSFLLLVANLYAAEVESDADDLGAEEFIQSKAVQLFVIHKYEEALAEFRILAERHPDEIAIQRYIGACLAELRRDDEAMIVLNEILAAHAGDLPTHKLLSKIHLRRGEHEKAREHLLKLVGLDNSDKFSPYAKAQLERLETIEAAAETGEGTVGRQLDPEEFLKTQAAIHFMDAKYEEAVKELSLLENEYPEDVRVKRYKGIALDKLERYEEAIETLRAGLKLAPENPALRYALAQSLFHTRNITESQNELRRISESIVSSDYKIKADRDLEAIETIQTAIRQAEKKWSFFLEQGVEFNTNAASEPTKLQVPAEEHAARFPGSFYASYQIQENGPWALSASYGYSHSFYSDTIDYLNTVVNAPTVNVSYIGELAGKPLLTMFSSGYVHVCVEDEFYYQSYPQTLRWIYSWWDWHRIILAEKFAYTDYKDQGSNPASTSREGYSNAMSATNNFYFNEKRDLYLGLGYEFKVEDPEGSNYVRDSHQLSADFNFPLWSGWSAAANYRYKYSDYPETIADVQRLDNEYVYGSSVTIPLNETLNLKLYYEYSNSHSNDPAYNYFNHTGGFSLACSF